jgi:hypothetical protein
MITQCYQGHRKDTLQDAGSRSVPRRQKTRKARDLALAEYLRPHDVWLLFGIPSSTLSELCNHVDPERRLPSIRILGRTGRKGIRLIARKAIEAWFQRWRTVA